MWLAVQDLSFPGLQIREHALEVVIEPCGILFTLGVNLVENLIFRRGQIP